MIRPRAHIAAMAPYALADLSPPGGKRLISLAQNESALPPSPQALAAGREALAAARLYPDPDWTDLRAAIARVHGLAPERILCGAGSMELIACLMRCYAGPGDRVLSSQYGYAFFETAARMAGAAFDKAPERDLTVSVDTLLAAAVNETRIVCIANPGNPTLRAEVSPDRCSDLRARVWSVWPKGLLGTGRNLIADLPIPKCGAYVVDVVWGDSSVTATLRPDEP